MNYLTRTVPPDILQAACQYFDSLVQQTAIQRADLTHAQLPAYFPADSLHAQLALPINLGGFGFTESLETSHSAYVNSVARSLELVASLSLLTNTFAECNASNSSNSSTSANSFSTQLAQQIDTSVKHIMDQMPLNTPLRNQLQ